MDSGLDQCEIRGCFYGPHGGPQAKRAVHSAEAPAGQHSSHGAAEMSCKHLLSASLPEPFTQRREPAWSVQRKSELVLKKNLKNLDWIADGRTKQPLEVLEGGGLFPCSGLRESDLQRSEPQLQQGHASYTFTTKLRGDSAP